MAWVWLGGSLANRATERQWFGSRFTDLLGDKKVSFRWKASSLFDDRSSLEQKIKSNADADADADADVSPVWRKSETKTEILTKKLAADFFLRKSF